jgi:Co/Zn/Cd efflux system component
MIAAKRPERDTEERRVLAVALGLNAFMFVVGFVAGLLAESLGLLADSLDMLADALAYGLSIAAVGRPPLFKARVATMSGSLLLLLGLAVLVDAARRAWLGSDPDSAAMIAVAALSLVVNTTVIRMLARFRKGEVHLRAAWLFTRADVVANLGVIVSALLVLVTGSRFPDIIAGFAISIYVIREAVEILQGARRARATAGASG